MVETFDRSHFKTTPWKNGGGVTTELYLMPSQEADAFYFRLSRADIATNGPFSIFPNIDRILLLLEGEGFYLKSSERQVAFDKKLSVINFAGEEAFYCSLINGPCVDFNVMTDRNFANSKLSLIRPMESVLINFHCDCDFKFIYDTCVEQLFKLEKNDLFNYEADSSTTLLVIEITLK